MAFRIQDSVIRGEVDNREKGIVRGRIWLAGRAEPLALELKGNACSDLAGCFLSFQKIGEAVRDPRLNQLQSSQSGLIGDLTASRKVRVLERSGDKENRRRDRTERVANCLYLEWFSAMNGRVVIEGTDFKLTISPPEWRLTEAEEKDRSTQAAAGMAGFLQSLSEVIARHQKDQKDPEEKWDEHDYEKFLKESDARTNKYGELLDKYGESQEAEERIAKEMGWDSSEDDANAD